MPPNEQRIKVQVELTGGGSRMSAASRAEVNALAGQGLDVSWAGSRGNVRRSGGALSRASIEAAMSRLDAEAERHGIPSVSPVTRGQINYRMSAAGGGDFAAATRLLGTAQRQQALERAAMAPANEAERQRVVGLRESLRAAGGARVMRRQGYGLEGQVTGWEDFMRGRQRLEGDPGVVFDRMAQRTASMQVMMSQFQSQVAGKDFDKAKDTAVEMHRLNKLSVADRGKLLAAEVKFHNEQKSWLEQRGTRLSAALATRSAMARVSGFAGQMAGAEGDALYPTLVGAGAKTATGAGMDIMTNRFIMHGGKGNFAGLIGAGILDAIVTAFQASMNRGIGIRREGTDYAYGTMQSFGRATMGSPGLGNLNRAVGALSSRHTERLAGWWRGLGEGGGDPTGITGNFLRQTIGGSQAYDAATTLKNAQFEYMRTSLMRAGSDIQQRWGNSVDLRQAFGQVDVLSRVANPGHLSKFLYGGEYGDVGNLAMLGGHLAGLNANTNLPPEVAIQLAGAGYMGYNKTRYSSGRRRTALPQTRMEGADRLARLMQMGLPVEAATAYGQSVWAGGAQGMTFNQIGDTDYLNSLMQSGMPKGAIGTYVQSAYQARGQAAQGIGGSFKGMLGDMTMVGALSRSGGDLSKAMDLARSASPYEQAQMLQQYLGQDMTRMVLQSQGMTADAANKLMGAGPSAGTIGQVETMPGGWTEALTAKNEATMRRYGAAYTPGEVRDFADATQVLEDAGIAVAKAAQGLRNVGAALAPTSE